MTPTTSSFTFNWLVIGEHVVFAVSVVLDRHLLYIACCSDWNAKAKSFCSGTKWAHWITPESAVLYLRKRRVREENILAKSVSGITYVWRCLQWRNRRWWLHCSKPPPPIKTWTMSIRTVMYHTITLVWSFEISSQDRDITMLSWVEQCWPGALNMHESFIFYYWLHPGSAVPATDGRFVWGPVRPSRAL